jgi:hypothetical protein
VIVGKRRRGSERAFLDNVAHRLELENHGDGGAGVVGVDHEDRRLEVGAWFVAEPSDDGHAAVVSVVVDEVLTAQIMVEVDLIPGFAESAQAVGNGLDPDRLGVETQELSTARRVVVQEENASADGWLGSRHWGIHHDWVKSLKSLRQRLWRSRSQALSRSLTIS